MVNIDYQIDSFCQIVDGKFLRKGNTPNAFHVITDSRKFDVRPGAVFFAIRGKRRNGTEFIENLYQRGVRIFVVSENVDGSKCPEATIIQVRNTIEALQNLAADHREKLGTKIIAITGSNGKTVVKEWLYQLLYSDIHISRSPRSYNSQIGVPLSVLMLDKNHELGIIEAGISEAGEMASLEKIIHPDIGIFTNIGAAHEKGFANIEAKIDEKLLLFDRVKTLIYCKDHSKIHQRINAHHWKISPQFLTWGHSDDVDLRILSHSRTKDNTALKASFHGSYKEIVIPFTSDASIENCCHLWLFLLSMELDDNTIRERFLTLTPVAMRLEQLEAINGCILINDVYNSDINSMSIALDYLKFQSKNTKFTAILSDILQSGETEEKLYSRVAELLETRNIDRFIGIGEALKRHASLFKNLEATFYESTDAFLKSAERRSFSKENILLKGARNFKFEQIADLLQEKSHETVLEIDLTKMVNNLNVIRAKLHPETKIMAMVKAFAYGSGSYDIARILEYHRVDYLAVAYADEGISLRNDGIQLPILVLNPEVSSYDAMIRYGLEPQIFSFRTLRLFREALVQSGEQLPYPAHIKVNTGMNRLGFNLNEIDKLADELNGSRVLDIKSVFSHLAASDEEAFDDFTKVQVEKFTLAADLLSKRLDKKLLRHLLNSSGILRFPEAQMDMVRLGLALYGITTNRESREELEPVSSLKTTISQIREIEPGEGVGYNPKQRVLRKTKIAVLSIGYADGLPRLLGNGIGKVRISDQTVPFIGNICMDMSMVDVTGVECLEGDQVEVFGPHLDIYDMAVHLQTIPYEVLTNISQRVKRLFIQD